MVSSVLMLMEEEKGVKDNHSSNQNHTFVTLNVTKIWHLPQD